jgi:hypothetical protein
MQLIPDWLSIEYLKRLSGKIQVCTKECRPKVYKNRTLQTRVTGRICKQKVL